MTRRLTIPIQALTVPIFVLTNFLDRVLTLALTFLDHLIPMPMLAGDAALMRPTRDVQFFTSGVHRLAQPTSRIGPEDDDEDGNDPDDGEDDEAISTRMNC